jgi:hypothetical protein
MFFHLNVDLLTPTSKTIDTSTQVDRATYRVNTLIDRFVAGIGTIGLHNIHPHTATHESAASLIESLPAFQSTRAVASLPLVRLNQRESPIEAHR